MFRATESHQRPKFDIFKKTILHFSVKYKLGIKRRLIPNDHWWSFHAILKK